MSQDKMKPIIIIPPGMVSEEDLRKLNDNFLCVVECKDPSLVKFVDPIPCASSRSQIEEAAIRLSKFLMTNQSNDTYSVSKKDIQSLFVKYLVEGTPLDPRRTIKEREQEIFSQAKIDELRRLAREEAKAERAAAKAKKESEKAKK